MILRYSILLTTLLIGTDAVAKESDFQAAKVFFKQHCVSCHGPEKEKGDIRLDVLPTMVTNVDVAETWQEVLDVLNAGEMPPEDEPQPKTAELATVIGALTDGLFEARKRLVDSRRVTIRRLNRREYANTIRDLLGVPVDVSRLPADGTVDGFDTIGDAHFMSTVQFEKYLELAREALDQSLVSGPRPERLVNRVEPEKGREEKATKSWRQAEQDIRERSAALREQKLTPEERKRHEGRLKKSQDVLVNAKGYLAQAAAKSGSILDIAQVPFGGQWHDKAYVTLPRQTKEEGDVRPPARLGQPIGRYVVRFRIGLTCKPKPGRRLFVNLIRTDAFSQQVTYSYPLGTLEVTRTIDDPHVIEVPFENRGEYGDRLALSVKGLNEIKNAKPRRRGNTAYPDATKEPYVWVDWMEVEGPILDEWPPAAWQHTFFDGLPKSTDMEPGYAREIIRRFAHRAFRHRHPTSDYVEKVYGIFRDYRADGTPFVDSMKEALAVVLASPSFVYLIEPAADGQPSRQLTDLELASRLSYFLWSHPPDEELYQLAEASQLSNAKTLQRQVERMLADPKSKTFTEAFVSQWLDLPWLDMIVVSKNRFPGFNENIRQAFRTESMEFFRHLIRHDLSARNLIDSDFVTINGVLAEYYGLESPRENGFQKVVLNSKSPRGGLLGQASILTMTSTGERTSPVERGVFVYSRLLGRDIPPPPPNVPQLEIIGDELTIRQRLTAHVKKAQCASCHRRMDPLGFGLEHFDAIGRWRDAETVSASPTNDKSLSGKERRQQRKKGVLEIDATGTMPDGRQFDGHEQLKAHLMHSADAMANGLLKSILTYALGRRVGFADGDFVERLQADWKKKDFRMRELIHAIVQTKEFQSK